MSETRDKIAAALAAQEAARHEAERLGIERQAEADATIEGQVREREGLIAEEKSSYKTKIESGKAKKELEEVATKARHKGDPVASEVTATIVGFAQDEQQAEEDAQRAVNKINELQGGSDFGEVETDPSGKPITTTQPDTSNRLVTTMKEKSGTGNKALRDRLADDARAEGKERRVEILKFLKEVKDWLSSVKYRQDELAAAERQLVDIVNGFYKTTDKATEGVPHKLGKVIAELGGASDKAKAETKEAAGVAMHKIGDLVGMITRRKERGKEAPDAIEIYGSVVAAQEAVNSLKDRHTGTFTNRALKKVCDSYLAILNPILEEIKNVRTKKFEKAKPLLAEYARAVDSLRSLAVDFSGNNAEQLDMVWHRLNELEVLAQIPGTLTNEIDRSTSHGPTKLKKEYGSQMYLIKPLLAGEKYNPKLESFLERLQQNT